MLEAKHIRKKYGSVVVLDDVSAQMNRGAVTVVMGPSGGGKSTLIRAMSLLESPDKGEILLDGKTLHQDCIEANGNSLWPNLTVVFQQLFLWPHKTIEENIFLPAKLRGKPLSNSDSLVERLGIQQIMNRYPNQVSIGQRQRAALARALLLKPQFLLLDEITAALDVEQIEAVLEMLMEYLVNNMGLMVVTHHLGFAEKLLSHNSGGRFIFLEHGQVIEAGNADSFLKPSSKRVLEFLATAKSVV